MRTTIIYHQIKEGVGLALAELKIKVTNTAKTLIN